MKMQAPSKWVAEAMNHVVWRISISVISISTSNRISIRIRIRVLW